MEKVERVTLGVGIIGCGAVGATLGSALRAAGHDLIGVSARSQASRERAEVMLPGIPVLDPAEIAARADLVLLTVSDTAIGPLAQQLASAWRPGQLVAHTCGALGAGVLEPAARAGAIPLALHPAMTFSGTSLDLPRLTGCPWAVTAPPPVLPIAQALVVDLEGEPFILRESERPLYHAALAHGANHLVTLVNQALRVLAQAGISEPATFAGPLLQAALERALSEREAGLSGPVRRGDAATVAAHLRELDARASALANPTGDEDATLPRDDLADVPATYRELARATARRCFERGELSETQYRGLLTALEQENHSLGG